MKLRDVFTFRLSVRLSPTGRSLYRFSEPLLLPFIAFALSRAYYMGNRRLCQGLDCRGLHCIAAIHSLPPTCALVAACAAPVSLLTKSAVRRFQSAAADGSASWTAIAWAAAAPVCRVTPQGGGIFEWLDLNFHTIQTFLSFQKLSYFLLALIFINM